MDTRSGSNPTTPECRHLTCPGFLWGLICGYLLACSVGCVPVEMEKPNVTGVKVLEEGDKAAETNPDTKIESSPNTTVTNVGLTWQGGTLASLGLMLGVIAYVRNLTCQKRGEALDVLIRQIEVADLDQLNAKAVKLAVRAERNKEIERRVATLYPSPTSRIVCSQCRTRASGLTWHSDERGFVCPDCVGAIDEA